MFLWPFQIIKWVWYSTDFKKGTAFEGNDFVSSFEGQTNLSPTDMSTSTAAATIDAFKQKDKEAYKLIKSIRDTNTKEREGRKGKNINLFDLLPETENRVEGDDGFSVIRLYSGLAILVSLIIV